jgi:hypothetical protein
VGLTNYHIFVPIVLKRVSLNLLEPTGLVQRLLKINIIVSNLGPTATCVTYRQFTKSHSNESS